MDRRPSAAFSRHMELESHADQRRQFGVRNETKGPTAAARNIWSCLSDLVKLCEKQLRRRIQKTVRTRIAKHVWRNKADSHVVAHLARTGHKFKFNAAEILTRGDNHVIRELLESLFTGPQSINKCNDLLNPYLVLRLSLARTIGLSGSTQANTFSNAGASEPDGRAIITPRSNMSDEISVDNASHAGHQTINAPERSRHH
ncbi:unnamed protein product [Schistocephalus solidus]|uniref:Uncharacterized protein n=1 Tax=Schistocephalus solidus TaxID=70667 RepID=A0A183SA93_SCHSO|nr:unnamed protein product [Schistocephalus solidus]